MNSTEQKRLRELAEEFGGYAANCPIGHECYVEAAIMRAIEPYRAALALVPLCLARPAARTQVEREVAAAIDALVGEDAE